MPRGTITAITRGRGAAKRRRLFIDGDPLFETSSDVVSRLELAVGDEWDLTGLESAMETASAEIARTRAYSLLGYRDRSPSELRERLLAEGLAPAAVGDAVEVLLTDGYLDEVRFAESLAHRLVDGRGRGREAVRIELEAKGITGPVAREAMEACCPADGEPARALALARRLAVQVRSADLLASRLVRRGFSTSVAVDAARRVWEENRT